MLMMPLPHWNPVAYSPPTFVIDQTIPTEWWFGPPLGFAVDVISRMTSTPVTVPGCWSLQLTDILLQFARNGRITLADVPRYLSYVSGFQVVVDIQTPFLAWNELLSLARTHSLTIYDAAYLELALRSKLPLATINPNLTRAAVSVGVMPFTP